MNTIKPTPRPNVKRRRARRTRATSIGPSVRRPLSTPAMLEQLELLAQQAAPPPAPNETEKPLGHAIAQLVFDTGVEAIKKEWKQTDPDSYALNRVAFALAPYCPAEDAWVLNLMALLTTGYGVIQVAERLKRDNRKSH